MKTDKDTQLLAEAYSSIIEGKSHHGGDRRMGKCNDKKCGGDLISRYPHDGWLQCSKCKQTISMKRLQDEQKVKESADVLGGQAADTNLTRGPNTNIPTHAPKFKVKRKVLKRPAIRATQ